MKKALIIVDVQNDFVEGGSLGVDGGKKVASDLAAFINGNPDYDLLVTTQDWHINPGDHFSDAPDFVDTWPKHCVAETNGAKLVATLAPALENTAIPREAVLKGQYDASYSGFDGTSNGRLLADLLRDNGIEAVDITGIATDYCVRATALDAVAEGFQTAVLRDFIAGINPEKVDEALTVEFPNSNIAVR